jgi:hypothetical protein
MAIIDIDRMYNEMLSTMKCNFVCSTNARYKQAKKLFLESVSEAIEQNKKDLIK